MIALTCAIAHTSDDVTGKIEKIDIGEATIKISGIKIKTDGAKIKNQLGQTVQCGCNNITE